MLGVYAPGRMDVAQLVYVVASESCALDAVGAHIVRDIDPGEIVVFGEEGVRSDRRHCGRRPSLCVFEYIYFARPDSVIEGRSVHAARLDAGRFLAQENPVDADVVVGVPDSGIDADSLAYLSVEAAHALAGDAACLYCDGCFTGRYPIGIPSGQGKNRFEQPIHSKE